MATPEKDGDVYSFTFGDLFLSVDASAGAKVSSLKLDNSEYLVTEEDLPGSFLWGSVLWPAPQSEFGWPPPMLLDDGSYSAVIDNYILRLTSQDDTDNVGNTMRFIKEFSANSAEGTVTIDYAIVNTGSSTMTKALWELVRVPVNGLTFWPTGPGGTWGDLASDTEEQNDHTWINIDNVSRRSLKFFADGSEGWLAHVDNERRLFIKKFEDVDQADFADGEGEIELWLANEYVELETIGKVKSISMNDTHHYNMTWYLLDVPAEITIEIGNSDLIAYVNNVIDGNITNVTHNTFATGTYLYPNVVTDHTRVKLYKSQSAEMLITDSMGRVILKRKVHSNNAVNLDFLKTGVYYYKLIDNDGNTASGKLFVK